MMTTVPYHSIGPQARAVIERDQHLLSPSYTREYPLVIARAEGAEVWDVDDRRYIDFMAGIGVLNVGHRHPQVVEAVQAQLEKFWHICLSDFYYPEAVDLAEKLAETAPISGPTRYYFANSGTEAIEAAMKLAMVHTGRNRFVSFFGSFHGRTLGALSLTASKSVQSRHYPSAVNVLHAPYPNAYRPLLAAGPGESYGETVIAYLEDELFRLKLEPTEVAAILVEAIQGEGGYVVPAPHFFPRLRALCDRYGIMLIIDEVQSGVGRTGRWWAIEHEAVEPDIVCFAKGIASGLPLGGIMAKAEVMSWPSGAHGSTFGGNPVAIAAAIATLSVIESENLLAQASQSGAYVMEMLSQMQARHPHIGQVRGRGLMVGIELIEDQRSKKRAKVLRDQIVQSAFRHGLLLLPCGENSIRFIPPLNISPDLLAEGLDTFELALTESEQAYDMAHSFAIPSAAAPNSASFISSASGRPLTPIAPTT
jgi:4-aminobutyrate aminotransferase